VTIETFYRKEQKMSKQERNIVNVEQIRIIVPPLNKKTAVFVIRGTSPYVQNKFSKKAKDAMKSTQEAGHSAKKGKAKTAKDFNQNFLDSQHVSTEGWNGIPCSAFRNAMIDACRMVGYEMTRAKMTCFIEPDGFDRDDSTPLTRITKGKPVYRDDYVRVGMGSSDIHARAMFEPGWEARVTISWDDDQFKLSDNANLLHRVGEQIGIGEGRPFSKKSCGCGWGMFIILNKEEINGKSKKNKNK
jgi:hypothetical protein